MDLGTIKKKVDNANYRDLPEFVEDVRLVFDNAILYNGPASDGDASSLFKLVLQLSFLLNFFIFFFISDGCCAKVQKNVRC